MNTSHSEAGEEENLPLELFPALFDEHGAGEVASTAGEGWFTLGNTTGWEVRHVRVHQLGTTYLTEEAVSYHSAYRNSSTDDPEHLTEVSENVLNPHVAITSVFMTNDQRSDGMIPGYDHLMLGSVRYGSILQSSANSRTLFESMNGDRENSA